MSFFPLNTRQNTLPVQMLPLKEKDREWKKACMDALEAIGRKQFLDNMEMLENYRMVNNEILYNHYVFTDSVTDLAQQAVKEFDLPPYLRNFDIINRVVENLTGKLLDLPDIFRVAATDEFSTNEYLEHKQDMLRDLVIGQLQDGIKAKLRAEGFNPDEQGADQDQQLQQETQKLTPASIEVYMKEKYRTVPETWGEMILKLDRQRFNTPEMDMHEFKHMLVSDRAYRHFYLKANGLGYNQETWNPIRVFWHKSPDVRYVEDGDYVGRVFYLSVAEIVNRYGYKMRKQDLEDLYGDYLKKKQFGGAEYSFFQATNVPFENYPEYARTVQAFGFDPHTGVPYTGNLSNISNQDVDVLFNSSSTSYNLAGLTLCTEGYWRSQKKVGFLIMKDPETGEVIEELVDETFIIPDFVTEVEDDPTYDDFVYHPERKMNTVRWTWINEVWGGTKINVASQDKNTAALYIDVKPIPFQFKGDTNPYECKLPVCGSIFNNMNAKSMSLVAMMKPYQILHNVFMNKIYQLAAVDLGTVLQLDPRMIPNDKNLGGERALQKMLTSAKETGIMQVDTSPSGHPIPNTLTAVNLSRFPDMDAAMKMAIAIEHKALEQIGVTEQALGQEDGQYTAEGVKQQARGSQATTASLFARFQNYLIRVKQMNLDIAQYCAATNRDMTISLVQDDMQRAFMQLNGTELLNSQLGVRVFTSQALLRQTELLKQLVLKNNTSNTPLSSLAEVIYTDSPAKIIEVVKRGEDEFKKQAQEKFQQDQQLQQQKAELEQQSKDKQNAFEAEQNQLDREERIRVAAIKSEGAAELKSGDSGAEFIMQQASVNLDQQKIEADRVAIQMAHTQKIIDSANKVSLEKQKLDTQKEIEAKKLLQKDKEISAKIELEKKKASAEKARSDADVKIAKIEHGHEMKSKDKDLEMQDKDLQHKEALHNLEKKSAEHKLNHIKKTTEHKIDAEKTLTDHKVETDKKLQTIKVDTTKKLNRIKISQAKKSPPKK